VTKYGFPGTRRRFIRGSSPRRWRTRRTGRQADLDLVNAMDTFIPEPLREVDKPFLMSVEDVFTITGRDGGDGPGWTAGVVKVGDEVNRRVRRDAEDGGHGVRCSGSFWIRRRRGTTSGVCCAGSRRRT